ncbi:MAG: glycosyltransferase family 2 protein, partial [Chloroflexota bacterium]
MNSPGKRAKVEVVIVNWQRSQDTIQCIRSIRRSESVDIHIVVIDNGSRDDSVEKISEAFPGISIISLTENLGFTGGYNSGIENALKGNASHIFLLNNDTIIEERTIKQLIDSNWDVAVPKITFYDEPEIIWAAGARWRSFPPTIKMIGYKKQDSPAFANAYPLEYATGCALMVKKEVLAEIKGFDPQYFNYMEDYDFSYQIRDSG